MKYCFICKSEIKKENSSKEHIIPNSIGGRKKVSDFICIKCNNTSGSTSDSELSKEYQFLSLFFNITREKGENTAKKIATESGTELLFHGNKITFPYYKIYEKETENGKTHITIKAKNNNELRNAIGKLKRKFQITDKIEDIISKSSRGSEEFSDKFIDSIRPFRDELIKSYMKSSVALIASSGIDTSICNLAEEFIKKPSGIAYLPIYYIDPIIERAYTPFHTVNVKGINKNHEIISYIEYFGVIRLFIKISDIYKGDDFEFSYSIDPIIGNEINVKIDFYKILENLQELKKISPQETEKDIYNEIQLYFAHYKKDPALAMKIIMDKVEKKAFKIIISKKISNTHDIKIIEKLFFDEIRKHYNLIKNY